jgi:murein DD-endopeptidase MepM/ murein hydrolase activator NlpD
LVLTRGRLLLAVTLVFMVTAPARADDLTTRQARNKKKEADISAQLNLARASDSQVEAEAARLDKAITTQSARADDAGEQLAVAQAEVQQSSARIGALQAQTDAIRGELEARAIYAYLHPAPSLIESIAHASDIAEAGRRIALLDHVQASSEDLLDQYRSARQDLAAAQREKEKAQAAAAKRAQDESAARDALAAAQQRQQQTHQELQRRISELQGEEQALLADDANIRDLLAKSAASTAATLKARGGGGNALPDGKEFASPTGGGFIWPVHGPVTSEFGNRWGGFHSGIDIGVDSGSPVHASKTGVVVYAGWDNYGYGNLVLVDHGGGFATAYGHNASVAVHVGQVVTQGQVVSYSDCTGNCTGPHVHFEVRVNGTAQNPRNYVAGSP